MRGTLPSETRYYQSPFSTLINGSVVHVIIIIAGADPGFLLGGGAPLRNDVTIQDFS